MSSPTSTEVHNFTITIGAETRVIEGRQEAVNTAKELSREYAGRVLVEREDGIVTMNFSNGQLDSFVYETRERRSRGPRPENRDGDKPKAAEGEKAEGEKAEAAAEAPAAEAPAAEAPAAEAPAAEAPAAEAPAAEAPAAE